MHNSRSKHEQPTQTRSYQQKPQPAQLIKKPHPDVYVTIPQNAQACKQSCAPAFQENNAPSLRRLAQLPNAPNDDDQLSVDDAQAGLPDEGLSGELP